MIDDHRVICPECNYGWYKYYKETEIPHTITGTVTEEEVPIYEEKTVRVVVRSPRGYLCIFCRYEWKEDGTPVSQEDIDKSIACFRKSGKRNYEKIHGFNTCPNRDKESKCSLDNKSCDGWMLSICEIKKQINQSLQGKAN